MGLPANNNPLNTPIFTPIVDIPPLVIPDPTILLTDAGLVDPEKDVGQTHNTWQRLEPVPLSADLTFALQATVADPAWMLCRQWQFLEFAGDDGGTPIQVHVEGEVCPITRFASGVVDSTAASRARAYTPDVLPLEVAVERESIRARHPRLAAEAGLHLVRMLRAAGLPATRDAVLAAFPLKLSGASDAGSDTAGREWAQVAQGRAINAQQLVAALVPLRNADGRLTGLPPALEVASGDTPKALEVFGRWLAWFEDAVSEPEGEDAWIPRRLEYSFGVGATGSAGEIVLSAQEYVDGALDWHSVSGGTQSLGTPATPPSTLSIPPSLPTPVEFAGKPADRFWEFEDANVNFAIVDAGPTDLARLSVVEFSLVYGNDWFIVPFRMPVGSVFRIKTFMVRDTFGVDTVVGPSTDAGPPPWSVFNISGGNAPAGAFFLAPTLADVIESAPIEEISLFRDEMANMVWGVERTVQGVSGDPYDCTSDEYHRAARHEVSGPPVDATLVYRLATSVPDNWIPFVPVAADGSSGTHPVVQLQRRVLIRTESDGTRTPVHPRGTVLRSDLRQPAESEPPLRIEEEEIPREGVVVTRSFQFGRWFDGRSFLWVGRRKRPGRGEGASGLRFDVTERA